MDRLFEQGTLMPLVVTALRDLTGRPSSSVKEFDILIEAKMTDPCDIDEIGEVRAMPYFRSYQVYAESEQEARKLARAFEQRCGGGSASVDMIEQIDDGIETSIGVEWLGERLIWDPDAEDEDE